MVYLFKKKILLVSSKDKTDVFQNTGKMIEHYIWPTDGKIEGSSLTSNMIFLSQESSKIINSQQKSFKGEINGIRFSVREIYRDVNNKVVGKFRVFLKYEGHSSWWRVVTQQET